MVGHLSGYPTNQEFVRQVESLPLSACRLECANARQERSRMQGGRREIL